MRIIRRSAFMKFPNAANGVSKIYTAEILALIGAVCGLVGAIVIAVGVAADSALALGSLPFVLAAGILLIIAFILNIVGVNNASKDEVKFKNAFIWLIAGIVAALAQSIFANNELLSSLFETLSSLFQLLSTIYVIQGTMSLARQMGNADVEGMGAKTLKLILVSYIIIIVIRVIAAIFAAIESATALVLVVAILGIVVFVIQIIAYIIYLKMLSRAKKMLN